MTSQDAAITSAAELTGLRAQRDELRAALLEFMRLDEECGLCVHDEGELVSALVAARKALAKVRP